MTHQTKPPTSNKTPAASKYITHISPSPKSVKPAILSLGKAIRCITPGIVIAASLLLSTSACTWAGQAQPWVTAGPQALGHLPNWASESTAGLRPALQAQCQSPARLGNPWPTLCTELAKLAPAHSKSDPALRVWIKERFDAWAVTTTGGGAKGLLTGYFEPIYSGSLTRESDQQTPLYAPPDSIASKTVFATRAQINRLHRHPLVNAHAPPTEDTNQALNNPAAKLIGREIAWLDDPVDAFFLHIQGSGRIKLRDNTQLRVGYAGNNGHRYLAIGRPLIRRGAIKREAISAQAIRGWLTKNSNQAQSVMNLNPRYIFFRPLPADKSTFSDGPIGSLGVALTPGRSLATDPGFLPKGTLVYLSSSPDNVSATRQPLARLAVSQDTGSAIRGAVRADLFTGTGESAGDLAGRLRDPMQLWLLWPKGIEPPGRLPYKRADLDD